MDIIHLSTSQLIHSPAPPAVLAIGFFDGVHLGHQQVLQQAQAYAKQHHLDFAVMTFDPHPSVVVGETEKRVDYLTPLPIKQQLLAQLGVDRLYIINFTSQFAQLTAEQFVQQFLMNLNINHLFCGVDFRYGCLGQGTPQQIYNFSNQTIKITMIAQQNLFNQKISTTKIRHDLSNGHIKEANKQLGRIYTTSGIVVKGEQRGHQLGFPTANVDIIDDYYRPLRTGVYAVRVYIHRQWYDAMANIGYKPTFHKKGTMPLTVEINIFDFNQDIYGEQIIIAWYDFIRDEQTFNGIDALIHQIKRDKITIQAYFSRKEIINEKDN